MTYKTNTANHAARELDILSALATDPDNRPIVEPFREELLALCEKFGESGQSGGSAPFTAAVLSQALHFLLLQGTIAPVTGKEEEWVDITEMNEGKCMYQNKRCGGLFQYEDGSRCYVDAIVFVSQNGSTFTSGGSGTVDLLEGGKIGSTHHVKSFPFEPKTFYIDVISTEWADKETEKKEGGGWWSHVLKDEEQLKEVAEYDDLRLFPTLNTNE